MGSIERAFWGVGAGKEAECGKAAEEDDTSIPLSPAVAVLLKGLLGDKAGCELLAVEQKGFGKFANV